MAARLVTTTNVKNVLDFCGWCAGICRNTMGKNDRARALRCRNNGEMSVFEHFSATWLIECSRSCSHQLVRHRLASYSQQSQRCVQVDVDGNDWFVPVEGLTVEQEELMLQAMKQNGRSYRDLISAGIKPEDARNVLGQGAKTTLLCTMNLREVLDFYTKRTAPGAQKEIRVLAEDMLSSLIEKYPEIRDLL